MPAPEAATTAPWWAPLVVTTFTGGLMGAFITAGFAHWRERRPRVAYRVEYDHVLRPRPNGSSLSAQVILKHDGKPYTYPSLYVAHVQLINTSRHDIDEFKFGVNLTKDMNALFVEGGGPNRLHSFHLGTEVTPASLAKSIDATFKPFVRNEPYWLRIYMRVPAQVQDEPTDYVELVTTQGVLVVTPTWTELATSTLAQSVAEVVARQVGIR